MSGDPLKKVQPGDDLEIPAETFNCLIDAAADFKARTQGFGQKSAPGFPQRTIIPVKNMSGGDRARFDVVELSQSLFDINSDAGKERPMAIGMKPGGPSGKIAVLLEPVPAGKPARCCVSGVTVARVDVKEKWHTWVDLKKDKCEHLESRCEPGGGKILSAVGETGVQLVLLKISNPPPVHFPAKITAVEWLTGGRYKYGFQEQEKTGALHAGWTLKAAEDGGRSGFAYNLVETVNDATCVPAQVNEIVWIDEVYFSDAGGEKVTEYWFQYEEYDQTAASSSGGYTTIDVVVCGGWNRCGNYIVLPQKRIYLPPGTTIVDLADDVIPIFECESSGDYPPTSDGLPPDSDAESSDFSFDIYGSLIVTGALTPDATGTYTYRGTFNGHPFWGREDNAWAIYWSDAMSRWRMYGGTAGVYFFKVPSDPSPLGYYGASSGATGTPHAAEAP